MTCRFLSKRNALSNNCVWGKNTTNLFRKLRVLKIIATYTFVYSIAQNILIFWFYIFDPFEIIAVKVKGVSLLNTANNIKMAKNTIIIIAPKVTLGPYAL